jgi:hypothetical protein
MTVAGLLAYVLAPRTVGPYFSAIIIVQESVGGSIKATDRLIGTIAVVIEIPASAGPRSIQWPSRALSSEGTNFVASKMPTPMGVEMEARYGTRSRVLPRGASQISVSCCAAR